MISDFQIYFNIPIKFILTYITKSLITLRIAFCLLMVRVWVFQNWLFLLQALKEWLLGIVGDLNASVIKTSSDNGKRVCSVLIVLDLLRKIYDKLLPSEKPNADEVIYIFSMLRLRPDISSEKFPDLNFVTNYIPQHYHERMAAVLNHFLVICLPTNNVKNADWISVIPLIHIFKKRIHPFDPPVIKTEKIQWTDRDINLILLRKPHVGAVPKWVWGSTYYMHTYIM